MTKIALIAGILFAGSVALAADAPATAPVPAATVGAPAPKIDTKDAKGRKVVVPSGNPMLLAFVSKATGDVAATVNRMARIDHPDADIITFIDVSGYPGILRGMVRGKLRDRHDEAVKDDAAAFRKAGKEPPADLDQRIHLVGDFSGNLMKQYGATDVGKRAHFVVVAPDGTIAAVFEGAPGADEVKAALDKVSARTAD